MLPMLADTPTLGWGRILGFQEQSMKMPFHMRRRTFLQSAAGAALASPLGAASQPNIRLGMDAYSIRSLGWKAAQILDYAKALKLDAVMLSSPDAFEGLEPAQLTKLRDDAGSAGILVETAIGSICPTSSTYRSEGRRSGGVRAEAAPHCQGGGRQGDALLSGRPRGPQGPAAVRDPYVCDGQRRCVPCARRRSTWA